MNSALKTGILLAGLLLSFPAESRSESSAAEPFGKGDRLAALELDDQHGASRRLDRAARRVLFTREMSAGRKAKAALEEDGAELMERSGTVYVSDVSRMPRLVRRLFAMPSLRRRAYPILLDFEGEATRRFPSQQGMVTVLSLDELRIVDVQFLEAPEAIRAALSP